MGFTYLFGERIESLLVVLLLDIVGDNLRVVFHHLGEIDHVGDVDVAGEYLVDGLFALAQTLTHFGRLEKTLKLVVQRVVLVERLLVGQVRQLTQEYLNYVGDYHRRLGYFLFILFVSRFKSTNK